jgi:protein involved in polysaccharide export with SLBB domain
MITSIAFPKSGAPARLATFLTLTLAWLAAAATSQGAEQFGQPGAYTFTNLKVTQLANDGTVATITADYTYDGFGKPLLKVKPVAERTGLKGTASWFAGESETVHAGRGKLVFQLEYLGSKANAPLQFTTDQITLQVSRVGRKELLTSVPFKSAITWGMGGGIGASAIELNAPAVRPVAAAALPRPAEKAPKAKPAPVVEAQETVVQAVVAQVPPNPPSSSARSAEAGGSFSATPPAAGAPWQERFTLGPGDVLNFSLFGEPDLAKREVFVGPDGRVSYLEANAILASGLTVDELRAKFDEELGKYRRSPRTIITPAAYYSKRYFLLGRVTQKGAYTLDRPITIIEAVARARGFETGLDGRNVVELADLSHSFLAREGKRIPVDFEQLFLEGNLKHNLTLAPGDYLYFPASNQREVYVLGEVRFPGVRSFTTGTTAVTAITGSGGFSEAAWKRKVMVVRGSLQNPEAFEVDVASVLAGKTSDFKLQAGDVVYVSSRPWAKVEELLDIAVTAFIQGAVITWTGGNIGPLIK